MRVKLLPRAVEDTRDIWEFGCDTWGDAQADTYSDALDVAIRALGENPNKAPNVDYVRPGVRRLVVGSHLVFYQVRNQTVEVIRVLHQSRDAGRWVR